jgi:hypothetical protein
MSHTYNALNYFVQAQAAEQAHAEFLERARAAGCCIIGDEIIIENQNAVESPTGNGAGPGTALDR